ncbi:hypothetical protein EON65_37415 [archaeon]|nr:MAG: hypothetical protein EON65_37415 [archaeon]
MYFACVQEQAEKKGYFSWEQLAESSFRADVASKHQLGPPANKKKRKDDATDPIAAYRPTPVVRSESHPATEKDAFSQGRQQPFPLAHDQKNSIISHADMLAVISQPGFVGASMSEATAADPIAKHFARWKLAGR